MNTRQVVTAERFAVNLFDAVLDRRLTSNTFISPASVDLALRMVFHGARGKTRDAMAAALELGGASPEEVATTSAALTRTLTAERRGVTLAIANALWAERDIEFAPEFLDRVRATSRADIQTIDFRGPQALPTINGWVRDQTRGRIDRIVERLDPATVTFLANAIYFKGDWARPFDRGRTREGDFARGGGGTSRLPFMQQSGEFRYHGDSSAQIVELPYADGATSMIVLLPAAGALAPLLQSLATDGLERRLQRLRKQEGRVALPRFRLTYGANLNDALARLGMGVAFDPQRADFSGMCMARYNVFINEVQHKTFLEVNEEGTEAAGVTGIGMTLASFTPSRPFEMVVDRPFVCAIRENRAGTLLFLGLIADPQQV